MKTILYISLIFYFTELQSQTTAPAEIQELTVGQHCPNFEFSNMLHYKNSSARLSDFRGKLVILDFWATTCKGCIASIKNLDSLQKKFGEQIMVLPITNQEKAYVNNFISTNKMWRTVQLPTVTGDTVLGKYFKYDLIPHEVLIDGNGFVKAITFSEDLNVENVQSVLNGKEVHLTNKKDILDRDETKPLLLGLLGNERSLMPADLKSSSIITGYIQGLPGMISEPVVTETGSKIMCANVSVDLLFQVAFGTKNKPFIREMNPDFYLGLSNRTIWEAQDSSLYYWTYKDKPGLKMSRDTNKVFCFELILPRNDSMKINAYAIQDLNRYFGNRYGIEGVVEKRKVTCWSLVRTTEQDLLGAKGNKKEFVLDDDSAKVNGYTLNTFMFFWEKIQMSHYPFPIIDETGYTGTIDIDIKTNTKDPVALGKALRKYGLDFVLVERNLDMIIIRDKKS